MTAFDPAKFQKTALQDVPNFLLSLVGKGSPVAALTTIQPGDDLKVILVKALLGMLPELGNWVRMYFKNKQKISGLNLP